MNILIFTNHFYPEQFKVNDVAFYLSSCGDDVTVVTCVPNYPQGKFYKGYGIFKKRKEILNGVKIIRLPLISRGKGHGIRLMFNYLSYFFSTLIYTPVLLFKKIDCVFVHETSPAFIGVAAVIVKRIKKIPMYFWVLDLWPESVLAVGSFSNKYVLKILATMVRWIYKNSDKILITSKGFIPSILSKGDFASKIEYFPNWAESVFTEKIKEIKLPQLPSGFKIMYAGNMGEAQDFEAIMDAVLKLKNETDIKWIFVGNGRKKSWVDEFVRENNLQNIVFIMGRYPIEQMPTFYQQADVMLLSLNNSPIFTLTVPARLQSYMACGKPIVAMINGEAANIITDAECGLVANSGDSKILAENILKIYDKNCDSTEMGKKAKIFYSENFDRSMLLNKLYSIIHKD